ncbi:hypothetical protein OQA88_9312 [Cercophora sp. LCS_1]
MTARNGHTGFIRQLLKHYPNIDQHLATSLKLDDLAGHVGESVMADITTSPRPQGDLELSHLIPLHAAIFSGNLDFMRLLYSTEAVEWTARSPTRFTALHNAVTQGRPDVVQFLLRMGHPVDIRDIWGKAPLDIAVIYGVESIVSDLIAAGADTAAPGGPFGCTPLMSAVSLAPQRPNAVRLLLGEGGSALNISDNLGSALAHCVAAAGTVELWKMLLPPEAGTSHLTVNHLAENPPYCAATTGNHIIDYLLEIGLPLDEPNKLREYATNGLNDEWALPRCVEAG